MAPTCNQCGAQVSMKERKAHALRHLESRMTQPLTPKKHKPHLCTACGINNRAPNYHLCRVCIYELEDE